MSWARLIQFFQLKPLQRELLIALILKFSLLSLIAAICFSHPLADQLTRADIANHLFRPN